MNKKLTRIVTATLALTLTAGGAQAAVDAKVTRDDLPVFDVPVYAQENYAGYLNEGEVVSVVEVRDEWAKITRNGKVGYTGSEYLEPVSSDSSAEQVEREEGYTARQTAVYAEASTASRALITLDVNTKVYVTGTSGDFCKVQNASASINGYIPKAYLSHWRISRETGYATQQIAVYESDSTSSSRLITLARGTKVYVLGVTGDFCRVQNETGSITGYAPRAYLSRTKPDEEVTRETGYTARQTAVYAEASTASRALITLDVNTKVYVTGTSGDFCKVQNASASINGYIPKAYLSHSRISREAGYATQQIAVYESDSTSSSRLITLARGTKVYVLGVTGDFCRVQNETGSITGYASRAYLSRTKPDEEVTRETGYTTRETAVYRTASTSSTQLIRLTKGTAVYVIGTSGDFCKVQNASASINGYIPKAYLSRTKPSSEESDLDKLKSQVIKLNWSDAQNVLNRGSYYTLYDIRNGQTISVKYTMGSSHMDIEPASASDTAKLKKALGGDWTWERTPIILIAEGRYIAASLYGEPHSGTDTVSGNNMDGVVCLHLTNSRTHGSGRIDEGHQNAIQAAYDWAQDR